MSSNGKGLTWKLGLSYGFPNYGLALMIGPAMGILHGFFAKNYAMSLWAIGMVFIAARIFDAVTDPMVGIASDKLRHRFWGRRSWITVGVLLSLVAMYFILIGSDKLTVWQFCVWMLVSFLAWTLTEIPYLAWGTEIAEDYNERTKLFSYKAAMGFLGSLIYLVLPLIIMAYQIYVQGKPKEQTTGDYSPLSMTVTFWMLAIVMPLALLLALVVCPDGSHVRKPEHKSLLKTLRILSRNKAMLIFAGAFMLLGLAGGLQIGMAYLHLSVYLGVKNTSIVYFFAFVCSLLGVPFWNWFAARMGKHVAFIVGLSATVPFFVWLALMKPVGACGLVFGQPSVFWQYLVTICALNFCQVVFSVMPPAIIGDIAASDMVETKTDEAATYYSVYTFLYKMVLGVGQGVALLMAGSVFGFDPKAAVQTDKAAMGLKLFMGYVPAALTLAGALLMLRYPITRKKYEEIQSRLKEMDLKTS